MGKVIGLDKLVIFPLTEDTADILSYGAGIGMLDKKLMTAADAPAVTTGELSASNQVVDVYVANEGGELTLGITDLTSEEREAIYGEQVTNGTNVVNKDDIAGNLCVAFMTTCSDGTVNLYKYPKTVFSPQAENYETRKKGSVTYATVSIKGTYMPTINGGDAKYMRLGADPVADAAIITSWFGTGEYFAPTESTGG